MDANKIYVKDYDDLRTGLTSTMNDILKNRTKEELRNRSFIEADIQTYIDDFLQYMQTPEISIEIEFAYFPMSAPEETQQSAVLSGGETEARRYSNGTEEDYSFLLALKKPNHQFTSCNSIIHHYSKNIMA